MHFESSKLRAPAHDLNYETRVSELIYLNFKGN